MKIQQPNNEELSKMSAGVMYCEGSAEYEKLQAKICLECSSQISLSFNNDSDTPVYKCPNCGKYYTRCEHEGRLCWQA